MAALARKLTSPRILSDSRERAVLAARTAVENKARGVLVLDMRDITPIYDYLVIATATSRRLAHTIAEEIDDTLVSQGDRRLGIEGYESGRWIVQDYGDLVVHVFDAAAREFYALEDLWADAPRVDWERE